MKSVSIKTPEIVALEEKMFSLMKIQTRDIEKDVSSKIFYSLDAHKYLCGYYSEGLGFVKRGIILPLNREECMTSNVEKRYVDSGNWPQHTSFEYCRDFIYGKIPGALHFGYALCGDVLFPTAFFVKIKNTWKIEGSEMFLPEDWVFDPIAILQDKKVDCYIGVPVIERPLIEAYFFAPKLTQIDYFPLELFVNREKLQNKREASWF